MIDQRNAPRSKPNCLPDPHLGRLLALFIVAHAAMGTCIVIRSDAKQIAVSADSKRLADPDPVCKIRPVNHGIFVAAGETEWHVPRQFYEAFDIGPEAAVGLDNPTAMIQKFTDIIEPKMAEALSFMDPWLIDGIRNGDPILAAAYVTGWGKNIAFYQRTFTIAFTPDGKRFSITRRDHSCPGTCGQNITANGYAILGGSSVEDHLRTLPGAFSLPPLDFTKLLVD